MSHIPEAKLQIVKGLVEQAPDKAVATLLMALNADGDLDDGLSMVKAIVEAEANDRRIRNLILAPIAPLCGPRDAFSHIRFPPRALSQIWRGSPRSWCPGRWTICVRASPERSVVRPSCCRGGIAPRVSSTANPTTLPSS